MPMAGPPSSLAPDLDRESIFQDFGVDYEDLLFYMKLNTIGNQVRIFNFLGQTKSVLIASNSLALQQGCFIFMTI